MIFCWVTINVKHMDKSLQFYKDITGLPVNRKINPNPEMEIIFLDSGETQVELIYNAKKDVINFGNDISLGFVVDSVERMIDALKEKNIPIHAAPFKPNPFTKFFYILDPDGLQIQFVENISQ